MKREMFGRLALEMLVIVASVFLALAANEWREQRQVRELVGRMQSTVEREIRGNRGKILEVLDFHRTMMDELARGERLLSRVSADRLAERGFWPLESVDEVTRMGRAMMREGEGPVAARSVVVERIDETSYRLWIGNTPATLRLDADGVSVYGSGNIQLRPADLRNTAWSTVQATGAATHLPYDQVERFASLHTRQEQYRETVAQIRQVLYGANVNADYDTMRAGGFVPMIEDMINMEQSLLEEYDLALALLGVFPERDAPLAEPRASGDAPSSGSP